LLEFAMIQIQAAPLSENEKEYFKGLSAFQWLVFTSANGVRYFFKNLKEIQSNTNLPETLQIAVIGNKTEKILNEFGFSASFKNAGSTGEEFAESFILEIKNDDTKPNILLSLGNIARTVIQDKIAKYATWARINVYQTTKPDSPDKRVLNQIKNDNYALIIFTSPSGINNFMSLLNTLQKENIRIACIGETTAKEARKNSIVPKVIATKSTTLGLFESVSNYYKNIKKL
jgi:uroporphyrinogen-III synthase